MDSQAICNNESVVHRVENIVLGYVKWGHGSHDLNSYATQETQEKSISPHCKKKLREHKTKASRFKVAAFILGKAIPK